MKNILSENMLRFGTKNLSEHQARLLTEGVLALDLRVTMPAQNAANQNIGFSLGPLGKNAANEYTGLLTGITIGGKRVQKLTNQKLTGEYITGEIMSTDANFDNLKSAIQNTPSNYLGMDTDIARYNATLVTKRDPNNPTAPTKNEMALVAQVIQQKTATTKQ